MLDPLQLSRHEMAKVLEKLPTEERQWRSTSGKAMSGYEYRDHNETEV